MNGENINIEPHRLRVLLSPLDWGLGHSTRIITIVKMLQSQGVEVLIAAESASASLLSKEFPEIKIIALKGYRIKYSSAKGDFLLTLVRQLPSVLKTIRYERRWLKEVVETHHIDATISDNRFGFLKSGTPSVYITHQLLIKTGHGWLDRIAQKIHYRYINRFNRCWVPDVEKGPSLAGKLSHPARFPQAEVKYIGPLSRFKKGPLVPIHIDLLVILSGPEPQRTIWEDMLLKQIPNFPYRVTLVRGLPGSNAQLPAAVNLKVYHHLPSTELEQQINKAGIILCRSGYSSVMDLVALGKRAILVPTPGQTEQEYLAKSLMEKQLFYSCSQDEFDLNDVYNNALLFPSKTIDIDFETLNERVIIDWVNYLKALK